MFKFSKGATVAFVLPRALRRVGGRLGKRNTGGTVRICGSKSTSHFLWDESMVSTPVAKLVYAEYCWKRETSE